MLKMIIFLLKKSSPRLLLLMLMGGSRIELSAETEQRGVVGERGRNVSR